MSVTEDHDSPWKEALECFFEPFLQLLYPDIHKAIDWREPLTFLDKELQKLGPDNHSGRRYADKLVKVAFRNGEPCWLLIHVEVQGQRDRGFPERMYVYYNRIRERYGQEVISLAVLTDTNPHYRPDRFEKVIANSGVHFRFRTVKLLDFRERMDELQSSDNPFALLVAAQLAAKLVKNGERRADELIGFFRAIPDNLDSELAAKLVLFLEWLVRLPPEIEEGYYAAKVEQLREEQAMPYVSSWERKGIQQGIEQGIHKGRAAVLARQLQLKFGNLPDELHQRLTQASEAELDTWAERILFVDSLDKLFE